MLSSRQDEDRPFFLPQSKVLILLAVLLGLHFKHTFPYPPVSEAPELLIFW